MKKILIKFFGKIWYCRMFHSQHTDGDNNRNWYCDKCNLSFRKRLSDDDLGL